MLTSTQVANEQKSTCDCSPSSFASDEDLLFAIADGDPRALELLYERYHQGLYSLAYKMVSDHQVAEDLLQETCLSVWRRATTYSAQASAVRTWLFTIMRHHAIDYLRKQRQQSTPKEIPLLVIEFDERFASADACEEAWHNEEQTQLREALRKLPKKQRAVLELSYFQGWTHMEIARMCNMPLGSVKSCMRLGLLQLKRELGKKGISSIQ